MFALSFLVGALFTNCRSSASLSAEEEVIRGQIPTSISDVLDSFNLEGKTTTYAVCPTCHHCHAPTFRPRSLIPIYPSQCTNTILEQGICGSPLLQKDDTTKPQPLKPFVYHHLDDFVGSLLSREDLEKHIDDACDNLKSSVDKNEEVPHFVHDIFQAPFMRKFDGPDNKLFIDRGEEGRLAFSLSVDGFNTEGLRKRGASSSSHIISLACLNLPYSIRYKPENMFLAGIIPGPHSPTETELNHYLTPLVDDMEASWKNGVFYSRTALHPEGRIVRNAIVFSVCDIPGARTLAGLAHHKHNTHFCSICNSKQRPNIGHQKDVHAMRRHAEQWRDASTQKDRKKLFEKYGVRYSVLWRLPYWDPTRQLVVDPMHNLIEGVGAHHFREVLGLSAKQAASKDDLPPAFDHFFRSPLLERDPDYASRPPEQQLKEDAIKEVGQIHSLLLTSLDCRDDDAALEPALRTLAKKLMRKNKPPLLFVYMDLGLRRSGKETKQYYVDGLIEWVNLSMFSATCYSFF